MHVNGLVVHWVWKVAKVKLSDCVSEPKKGNLTAAPENLPFCRLYLSAIVSGHYTCLTVAR